MKFLDRGLQRRDQSRSVRWDKRPTPRLAQALPAILALPESSALDDRAVLKPFGFTLARERAVILFITANAFPQNARATAQRFVIAV